MSVKRIAPVVGILAASMGFSAVAIGTEGLPDVPKHRHWQMQPNGTEVQVGPRLCDDPSLQQAFNQFHFNNHVGNPKIRRGDC